jgi:hypothetical protein
MIQGFQEDKVSPMRRMKFYLRSTIGDERLSNLSLMHIHRHVQVDLDMIRWGYGTYGDYLSLFDNTTMDCH